MTVRGTRVEIMMTEWWRTAPKTSQPIRSLVDTWSFSLVPCCVTLHSYIHSLNCSFTEFRSSSGLFPHESFRFVAHFQRKRCSFFLLFARTPIFTLYAFFSLCLWREFEQNLPRLSSSLLVALFCVEEVVAALPSGCSVMSDQYAFGTTICVIFREKMVG